MDQYLGGKARSSEGPEKEGNQNYPATYAKQSGQKTGQTAEDNKEQETANREGTHYQSTIFC